jgi:hypothetical protein
MARKPSLKARLLAGLLYAPGIYKRLVSRIARNPEALYQILSEPKVRRHILAQLEFLKTLAAEKNAMKVMIENIPVANRTELLLHMLETNPNGISTVFQSDVARDNMIDVLANDPHRLSQAIEFASLLNAYGENPANRAMNVFMLVYDKPFLFRQLGSNQEFRTKYLELFLKALEISKTDLKTEIAAASTSPSKNKN